MFAHRKKWGLARLFDLTAREKLMSTSSLEICEYFFLFLIWAEVNIEIVFNLTAFLNGTVFLLRVVLDLLWQAIVLFLTNRSSCDTSEKRNQSSTPQSEPQTAHICLLGTGELGRIVHIYLEFPVVLRRHQRKLLSERIKNLGLNHRFLNKARYFDLLITEHFTDYKTSKTKTGRSLVVSTMLD